MDKKLLWKLYAGIRKLQRDGEMSYQEINAEIAGYMKDKGDEYKDIRGISGLEKALGIHDDGNEMSRMERLGGSLLSVAEGVTFGHAGEIAGGVSALMGGDYAGARQETESNLQRFKDNYKTAATIGEVSGAALPFLMTSGASGTGAAGGLAARTIGGAGRGAAEGLIAGAAYGHGTAEPGGRTKGALVGGAVGTAVGTGVGGILPVAGALGRKMGLGILDMGGRVGQKMANRMRRGGMATNIANAEVAGAVKDTGRGMGSLVDEFADMPQAKPGQPFGSRVADLDPVLAEEARAAQKVARTMDKQGGTVRDIESRQLARGRRIVDDLRERTGLERAEHTDEVLKAAQDAWRETHLYPLQQRVGDFGDMRMGKFLKEFPEVVEDLRMAGQDMGNLKEGKMSMQMAHDALDGMRHRAGGRMAPNAKQKLIERARAFQDFLEEAVPEFGESQRAYRQLRARHDAYASGTRVRNKSGPEIKHAFDQLTTDPERRVFRESIMDGLEDTMLKGEAGGAKAKQLVRTGDERDKLRILFDSSDSFERWIGRMDDEGRWSILFNALKGPGKQARGGQDVGRLGGYVTTGRAIMNEILSVVFEDPTLRRSVSEQVGEMLTRSGPKAATELAMRLAKRRGVGAMNTKFAGYLGSQLPNQARQSLMGSEPRVRPKSIFE